MKRTFHFHPDKRAAYPFKDMQVGDYFDAPPDLYGATRQAAYLHRRANGGWFHTHLFDTPELKMVRCMRIA